MILSRAWMISDGFVFNICRAAAMACGRES
jgi:hypothetical protein